MPAFPSHPTAPAPLSGNCSRGRAQGTGWLEESARSRRGRCGAGKQAPEPRSWNPPSMGRMRASMAGCAAAAPRGPYGAWLCLLVALALEVVRGQWEGRGGVTRLGRGRAPVMPSSLWALELKPRVMFWRGPTLGNRLPAGCSSAFFPVHHLDAPRWV